MEKVVCETCGKTVKGLKMHLLYAHPETLKVPSGPENPIPEPGTGVPSPDDMLRGLGIDPGIARAFIEPMVAKAVGETLGAMHLDKLIQSEIPKAVESYGKALVSQQQSQPQPDQPQPDSGQPQQPPLWAQQILGAIGTKIIGGDSGGSELEKITKYLALTKGIADAFYAPIQEAELRAQKRIVGQLDLFTKAGATKEEARQLAIEANRGGE